MKRKTCLLMMAGLLVTGLLLTVPCVSAIEEVKTYASSAYDTEKDNFEQGETVYVQAIFSNKIQQVRIENSTGTTVYTHYTSPGDINPIRCAYTLPEDAPTGTWDVRIHTCSTGFLGVICGLSGVHKEFNVTPKSNEVPEFSTIAIPVASILGLLLFFNYRRRRREEN